MEGWWVCLLLHCCAKGWGEGPVASSETAEVLRLVFPQILSITKRTSTSDRGSLKVEMMQGLSINYWLLARPKQKPTGSMKQLHPSQLPNTGLGRKKKSKQSFDFVPIDSRRPSLLAVTPSRKPGGPQPVLVSV